MKLKRTVIFTLFAVMLTLLLAACSAEIVNNLPAEEIKTPETMDVQIEAAGESSLTVRFSPVPYASAYAYRIAETGTLVPAEFTYEAPYNVMTVTLSPTDPMMGTLELYARTSNGDWIMVSSSGYAHSLSSVAPDIYLSSRSETSAEIRVNSRINPALVIYNVELRDSAGTESINSYVFNNTNVMIIDDLQSDSEYTVYVSQATVDDLSFSEASSVSIPVYNPSLETVMDLELSSDGLTVTNATDSTIALYKQGSLTPVLEGIAVSGGSATIAFTDLKSLESGAFYVSGNSGKSNLIEFTVDPRPVSVTGNWRSAEVYFDFADDFDASRWSVSVSGQLGVTAEIDADKERVIISGLDSNCEYTGLVLLFTSSELGASVTCSADVTTRTYAGMRFAWEGTLSNRIPGTNSKDTNFVLRVEAAPDGSDFPYYVYFDDTDKAVIKAGKEGQNLRVMPLIDDSADLADREGMPSDKDKVDYTSGRTDSGLDFSKQNEAYVLNSEKWNYSTIKPVSWYINKDGSSAGKNIVTTSTISIAVFIIETENETITTFEFDERRLDDGTVQPFIRFENLPGRGMASMGLQKNANPQCDEFGDSGISDDDAKYNWYLTPVEGGAQ